MPGQNACYQNRPVGRVTAACYAMPIHYIVLYLTQLCALQLWRQVPDLDSNSGLPAETNGYSLVKIP